MGNTATFSYKGLILYLKNTSWLMADKVLRLLVGLFVGVYVARYLGPDRFGLLSFAMSFVALFGAFGKLGLDAIVVRNAVNDLKSRNDLLGTAFGLRIIGGLLLLSIVFSAIKFTVADSLTKILVMIIAAGHVLQVIISSFFKLLLIWCGAPLIWFAWIFTIEQGLKGILLCVLYTYQRIPLRDWRFRLHCAKNLLRDSWPLIFSGLVIMVYMRIDQVMVKIMLGNQAAGNYAAAVRLSEVWLFITIALTQSLMPAIIKAKSTSENLYLERLLILYRLLITIALIISILITLTSKPIVLGLLGIQYESAIQILKIYVWSTVFVYMNNASWQWFLVENLQYLASIRLLLGAVCNILCNYYLIEWIGVTGAAWSTLISYSIAAYFGNLLSPKMFLNFRLLTKALFTIHHLKGYRV